MEAGLNATKDSLEIRAGVERWATAGYISAYNVTDLYLKLPFDVESGKFGPDEDCIVVFKSDSRTFYSVPEEISFVYTKNTENKIAGTFSMSVTLDIEDGGAARLVKIKDGVFNIIKSELSDYSNGVYSVFPTPYMEDLRSAKAQYQAFCND